MSVSSTTSPSGAPAPVATPNATNTASKPLASTTSTPAVNSQGLSSTQMGAYAQAQASNPSLTPAQFLATQGGASSSTANPTPSTTSNPTLTQAQIDANQAKVLAEQNAAAGVTPTNPVQVQSPYVNYGVDASGIPIQPPNVQPVLSNAAQEAVAGMTSGSGVYDTSSYNSGVTALGNALESANDTALSKTLAGVNAAAAGALTSLQNNAAYYNELISNPGSDPQAVALASRMQALQGERTAAITSIQKNADQQVVSQVATNKQLEGSAKAAVNAAGQVGSMVGAGYIAAQIQNNQNALNAIQNAEQDAITKANAAYDDQDFQVAMTQATLADTRRQQANDIAQQTYTLMQNLQSTTQNAQLQQLQIQSQQSANATQSMAVAAQGNVSPYAIPASTYQNFEQANGLAPGGGMAYYQTQLAQAQTTTQENFATSAASLASSMTTLKQSGYTGDLSVTLKDPTTGKNVTFSPSSVTVPPAYNAVQQTVNGRNQLLFYDTKNPTADPIVHDLGAANINWNYQQDGIGNTWAVDPNNPNNKQEVFDFAGRPVQGTQSIINNTTAVNSAPGTNFTASDANPTAQSGSKYRTDRNNNPTAMTTAVAAESGLVLGKDYVQGDMFVDSSGKTEYTAKLLGDPIQQTIKAIDQGGFTTSTGNSRWTYINVPKSTWDGMTQDQKTQTVLDMYKHEGGSGVFANQAASQNTLPVDNNAAWHVQNVPANYDLKSHIQNGTVTDVFPIPASGTTQTLYGVSIKDQDTGTITTYSGLTKPNVSVGQQFNSTTSNPSVGVVNNGSYGQAVNNADGSPVQPVPLPATPEAAAVQYGTWGQSGLTTDMSPAATKSFAGILKAIGTGMSFSSAIQQVKNSGLLKEFDSSITVPQMLDAANAYQVKKQNTQATMDSRNTRTATNNLRQLKSTNPTLFNTPLETSVASFSSLQPQLNTSYEAAKGGDKNAQATLISTVNDIFSGGIAGGIPTDLNALIAGRSLADKVQIAAGKIVGTGKVLTAQETTDLYNLANANIKSQSDALNTMKSTQASWLNKQFPGQDLGKYVYQINPTDLDSAPVSSSGLDLSTLDLSGAVQNPDGTYTITTP